MLLFASQRAGYDHSSGRADHQAAGDLHEGCPADAFELPPQFVRPLNERDVQRMLEVRLTDDATVAVRRTKGMAWSELLEAEDAHSTARQMKERCAPHRAEADDDHVVATLLSHLEVICTSSCNSTPSPS